MLLTVLLLTVFHSNSQSQPDQKDFTVKAFHIDLRIQVMTMSALQKFALKLHDGGINTLIMEYEATYPYASQPIIPNRYAYTKNEIISFVSFCNKLGIDVIPLQQSFGHVEYILRHYKYAALREDEKDLSQVCPLEITKDSLLFTALFAELASTHTSKYIHIGADETHLLGHCEKCRRKVAEEGISKLYIDYIKMLCGIVTRLGKRPVLWADIALKYPEALKSLPKETILVDWNYGWDLSRFGDHKQLVESGLEIWGAPALRSHPDNFYLTQWEKHFKNIRDFVPLCRQMGYKGIVMTSWSTSGAYSALYESEDELTDLYAIRHVYPITGFNILLAAYIKSISSSSSLDIENFVSDYCATQYGFTKSQAKQFWEALRAVPYEVSNGMVQHDKNLSLAALTDSMREVVNIFYNLKPLKHQDEFEHYRLMADIRLQYLEFLEIEKQVNAETLTQAEISIAIKKLETLMTNAAKLDQRFIQIHKENFYLPELKQENEIRNKRLQILLDRFKRVRA